MVESENKQLKPPGMDGEREEVAAGPGRWECLFF